MAGTKQNLQKEIHVDSIGIVKITKRRGRSIRISLDREGSVFCALPLYSSQKDAIEFISSKKEWILKHQLIIKNRKHEPIDLTNGFQTKYHKLLLIPEIREDIKTTIKPNIIEFRYPGELNIKSQEMQLHIRHIIEETWRKEAKSILIDRTNLLAKMHGFKISSVKIRKTISRWGSCSYQNAISLSLYLMQLPDKLIDMVIIHELCHTIEKNHGPKYKQLLKQICPDIKQLEKEIKRFTVYPF